MTYAVIRIRGRIDVMGEINETLRYLRLNRVNHCVLVPEMPSYEGMLQKAKDYITWGEVQAETLAKLLITRGTASHDGSKVKINDDYVKNVSKYTSLLAFAKAVSENQAKLADLKGAKPVLRLHPPAKGYEGIKRPYSTGGALGYRGEGINPLIERMLAPRVKEKKEKKGKEAKERVKKKTDKGEREVKEKTPKKSVKKKSPEKTVKEKKEKKPKTKKKEDAEKEPKEKETTSKKQVKKEKKAKPKKKEEASAKKSD